MPTIHYSDHASLSQLGVTVVPQSVDEIRTKLKRDPNYFDIPISRADNDEEQRELDDGTANDDNGKQQSNQKSIAERDESKTTCSDTTDRQIDTNKKDSPFNDKSSADKIIPIAVHTKSKAPLDARKKKRTLGKSSTRDCNDIISNEDNQGDYDVPIAERLKLRREKRKAETDSTAKIATHDDIGTPIAERLKRRRTNNNAPDAVEQDTTTSKSTRKRKASSSSKSNKTTEVTTPKSSKKKTCASKEDLDYRKTGIRQLASGNKWSVEIGYHKKRCYPGTYEDKEHAVLANKVAREYLLPTRDLQLTDGRNPTNIDLAKEAALEAVNELLVNNGGASDSISEKEDDKQPPASTEEEDNTSATTAASDGISIDRDQHIQSKITHRRQLLAWVKVARLACEKNKEMQPDFIQDTLKHASSASTLSGGLISEVANYQALTNMANCQQSSTEKTDARTVGVCRLSSGKGWEVRIRYHGKNRYIGSYQEYDRAILANNIARRVLEETMDSVLSIEETVLYVSHAKEAVRKEILQETKESVLSPKESKQNVKLAKKTARKAMSEMESQRSEEHMKTAAQTSKPQQSNKKEELAVAVASETRQDSEDVTLQLPTHKEVETNPTSPLPWYYID